jgi:hypothetical protein
VLLGGALLRLQVGYVLDIDTHGSLRRYLAIGHLYTRPSLFMEMYTYIERLGTCTNMYKHVQTCKII